MKCTVIFVFRPWKGKEEELLGYLRQHIPVLRREGLMSEKEPMLMRASDGAIIEVIEWQSKAIYKNIESNRHVQKMWEQVRKVSDFEKPVNIQEFREPFSEFESLETNT